MTKNKTRRPSAAQLASADQLWAQLLSQLDREMTILVPSRREAGRILFEIKKWMNQWGLNKGRRGRWQEICDKYFDGERKTAENWVRAYQKWAEIPVDQCVFKPAPETGKSQSYGENNPVKVTGIDHAKVRVEEEEEDTSREGRTPVECVFILTREERIKFLEALRNLDPLRATQLMYLAVVEAV
jgi:hypothetical protein